MTIGFNRIITKCEGGSCKNCFNVWNRDVNGSTNIYKIAFFAINKKERPKYLYRDKKEERRKKKLILRLMK